MPCCYRRSAPHECYIFANFSQIPTSISHLTVSSESQWNVDSNDMLCVWKYYQPFTYQSNTFLCQNMHSAQFRPMGAKNLETAHSLGAYGPPCNIPIPWLSPLTIPNNSLIGSCTSAQLRIKVPVAYNGMPQIQPKNCPSTITTQIEYTHPLTDPIHHPKWLPSVVIFLPRCKGSKGGRAASAATIESTAGAGWVVGCSERLPHITGKDARQSRGACSAASSRGILPCPCWYDSFIVKLAT